MEVLASISGALVAEISRLLGRSIHSKINYSLNFHRNHEKLEKEIKNLVDLNKDIKNRLDSALNDGRSSPTIEVKRWLREFDAFVTELESLQPTIAAAVDDNRFCGSCTGLCRGSRRSTISRQMEEMLPEAKRLLEAGSFPNGLVSEYYSVQPVEYIPGGPQVEYQTSASSTLSQLFVKLEDDMIGRIGVWGMGGVGKSTLIKNLNNKLIGGSTSSSGRPFSIVIWVTVSKELDEKRIQQEMAERLGLKVNSVDNVEKMAVHLHQRLLKEERFLLILDDVWENIDLDRLGVPPHETHKGSKIILTSRSLEVCGEMMVDFELKVNTLDEVEAWQLFSQKAGEVVRQKHIQPYAEAVARECGGLPLALITVGTAMRGKLKVEQWDQALMQLRRSKPRISGVEEKVFNPLKWSYDSLKDENTKACFLYCALFPEDFSIEISELVQCWTAEGFIDEQLNSEDSTYVNGIVMVETLKDSCLLEDGARKGTIKMHDVVRDVAIWIASSLKGEHKHESLVRSGINLIEISMSDFSNSLKRVSFMNNKISELPDYEIQGSEVSTLLLQGNHQLEKLPERFLQSFPALRVLNVSKSRIQSLPSSLLHLSDLRALLLGNCILLEMLPLLGMLSQLRILDLTGTRIRELPKEMGNLIYLRQVKLSHSTELRSIAAGVVSKWTCLEVLDMAPSSYAWGARGEVEEGQATFEELGCLKQLVMLSINLKSIPWMVSVILSSMCRLRKFKFFIGDGAINIPNNHDEQMVSISGLYLSMERVRWFLANASSLVLNRCSLEEMLQELAFSSVCHGKRNNAGIFEGLRLLTITGSNFASKPHGVCVSPYDILPNLEELHLHNLNSLESISELFGNLGLTYSKLKLIEVSSCPNMKCLLYYGCFILSLPILETIKVSSCIQLEHLFNYTLEQSSGENPTVVPKLRILELKDLDQLANLCRRKETWPCLEKVFVVQCGKLTNLPLSVRNANTIKEIKGEPTWWAGLRWDDANIAHALQSHYKPIGFWRQDSSRF